MLPQRFRAQMRPHMPATPGPAAPGAAQRGDVRRAGRAPSLTSCEPAHLMQSKVSESLNPRYATRGSAEQRQEEQHGRSGALMRRANLILHSQAGSTVVGAMVFSFVMMLSALALMRVGTTDATLAVRDVRAAQAFYLAYREGV